MRFNIHSGDRMQRRTRPPAPPWSKRRRWSRRIRCVRGRHLVQVWHDCVTLKRRRDRLSLSETRKPEVTSSFEFVISGSAVRGTALCERFALPDWIEFCRPDSTDFRRQIHRFSQAARPHRTHPVMGPQRRRDTARRQCTARIVSPGHPGQSSWGHLRLERSTVPPNSMQVETCVDRGLLVGRPRSRTGAMFWVVFAWVGGQGLRSASSNASLPTRSYRCAARTLPER